MSIYEKEVRGSTVFVITARMISTNGVDLSYATGVVEDAFPGILRLEIPIGRNPLRISHSREDRK